MGLVLELRRRNVFRVAVAYLAAAWLLTEVASTLFPIFGVPEWGIRLIVIVFAVGLIPALIFSWVYELTPEGLKREQEVEREASITHLTARRLDWMTIGMIVIAISFVAIDRLWLGSVGLPSEMETSATADADQPPADNGAMLAEERPPSIAVLPFANRSANPDDAYFVEGVHDDLLTHVSQIGSLKVISRTSVMKYRDTTRSIPEIAAELDVATVLEGGVQRAGDQVRINVQLIDANTDDHLWSQIYDRQLSASNVFAIQSEIARAIAEALRAELSPQARDRFDRVPTENLAALEAYFLGRQSMATRRVADLAMAVKHFDQAVALDPEFALAYASLALACGLYQAYAHLQGNDQQAWLDRGQAAAQRALQLDRGLAEAHTSAGKIKDLQKDREGAEAALRRAIQLNPNEAQAFQWLGHMLGGAGRVEEALEYSRQAVSLDPKSAITRADYGEVLNKAGRFDEALAQYRQAVAFEPQFSKGYRLIGTLAMQTGNLDEAISAYRRASDIEPDNWLMLRQLGMTYLSLGDDQQAERWFSRAMKHAPRGVEQMGASLGRLYLYRGDKERARVSLESVISSNADDRDANILLIALRLAEGDIAGALSFYQRAFPTLLADEPVVERNNTGPALLLAAVHARAGETAKADRLLDRALEQVNSWDPKVYALNAAVHALRGDKAQSLGFLKQSLESRELWLRREIDVFPYFEAFQDDLEYQALIEGFDAELARQLARVREWEASGESAAPPER